MQPEDAKNQHLTFKKKERICSKLTIERLLEKKQKFFVYPFKCYYDFTPRTDADSVHRILITVPKRNFKHAVDRNRLKRLIREAYRQNHRQIFDNQIPDNLRSDLFFLYVGKEILPYNLIEDKIIEILQRLTKVVRS